MNLYRDLLIDLSLIILLGFLIISGIEYRICSNYESVTGKETEYFIFDSCYISHDGNIYRFNEYKYLFENSSEN